MAFDEWGTPEIQTEPPNKSVVLRWRRSNTRLLYMAFITEQFTNGTDEDWQDFVNALAGIPGMERADVEDIATVRRSLSPTVAFAPLPPIDDN